MKSSLSCTNVSSARTRTSNRNRKSHLVLAQLVGQVGNHNLSRAGDSVLGGAPLLLALEGRSSNTILVGLLARSIHSFDVGGLDQWNELIRTTEGSFLVITGAGLSAGTTTLES